MPFEQCQRVTSLLSGFHKPWFFAGGWAIDLFIGRETRLHLDMEIALFRSDQLNLKEHLKEWNFRKVVNGTFQAWEDEFLELPIHEIHACHKILGDELEILLNEEKDGAWIFRRDLTISRPLKSVWSYTDTGIPYLHPEIVLLYKVKNTREKDYQDFFSIVDLLEDERKKWLRHAIQLHEPEHAWLRFLTDHIQPDKKPS